ncbi:MAG TPA: gliding motility-associated C-terminal domain-containing protein [Hymenobacter sp.]|uniref:T9SS type B sorting domain-containing protein n=1 Tax=Hymenobacter sp. TaxID=1898978 RepID=UPI002D7F64FC|nr:gliding motility-associated C-terminal domain-containing protein [Hymenobacter sp.]HET9504103.1 gliding motility-associated C-terminal domain-containing protein [Hymenobacter sp.]
MKQLFTRFCCLLGGLVGTSQLASAQLTYTPAAVTGYSADVIAEGTGTVASKTTNTVDRGTSTVKWCFANTTYVNPSGASPVLALPASGLLTSAVTTTPGLTFQLAPATGNNSLRIDGAASGTLTLVTPAQATEVVMLGTEGNGSSAGKTFVVNFTDGTSQSFSNQVVPDWFGGANPAYVVGSRVSYVDNSIDNATTNPRLYQVRLALAAANLSKQVASITVSKTSTDPVLNIMGVTLGVACQGAPNAGTAVAAPATICPGQQVALSPGGGAQAPAGITFQWQSSTDGGVTWANIAGATGATYIGTPTVTTQYRVILTCTGQSSTSAPTTVTVGATASVVAYATPPAPVTLCASGTQTVVSVSPTGGTFSAPSGLSINATTGTLNLGASAAGTYTVTYTPPAGSCAGPATTTVSVVAPPTATLTYPAGSFCAGSGGTVTPTTVSPAGGRFVGSTGLVINASGVINLSQTPAGTYTITYTVTGTGLCTASATASVTVLPAPAISLNFGGTTFCKAGAAPVTTATPAGGIFSSTPGLVINITTGAIDLANSTNGTYTVTYSTSGQCGGTASARITVQGSAAPVYPTVLTPNGDKLNDELKLKIADVQNYSLKVFNRWGRRVYEGTNAAEGWNPADNGPGTYFYQVEYTDCAGRAQLARNWVEVVK